MKTGQISDRRSRAPHCAAKFGRDRARRPPLTPRTTPPARPKGTQAQITPRASQKTTGYYARFCSILQNGRVHKVFGHMGGRNNLGVLPARREAGAHPTGPRPRPRCARAPTLNIPNNTKNNHRTQSHAPDTPSRQGAVADYFFAPKAPCGSLQRQNFIIFLPKRSLRVDLM